MSHGRPARFVPMLDAVVWYGFLILMCAASFLSGGYVGKDWLYFSACFYFWFSVAVTHTAFGGRFNRSAVSSAGPVILLLGASLIWLLLPLLFEYDHALYRTFNIDGGDQANQLGWLKLHRDWSVAPDRTRWLFMSEFLFFCMFLSALALIDKRERLKQLFMVFIAVGAVHAMVGLIGQAAGILFVDPKQVDGHFSVARGLFINRNHFAAFLILTLGAGAALQIQALIKRGSGGSPKGFLHRIAAQFASLEGLLWAFIGVIVIACVSSTSRGAVLSLFLSSCVLVLFRKELGVADSRPMLLLMLGLVLLSLVYFGHELISRLTNDALSIGERAEQWRITLQAIMQNPLFGYGGGSYKTVFQIFRGDSELRQVVFAQSHNHYLHIWLERGFIGLGLWLAILFFTIRFACKKLSNSPSTLTRSTLVAGLLVICAALIQSMVDFNLQILNIRAYFITVLAVVFVAPHLYHGQKNVFGFNDKHAKTMRV